VGPCGSLLVVSWLVIRGGREPLCPRFTFKAFGVPLIRNSGRFTVTSWPTTTGRFRGEVGVVGPHTDSGIARLRSARATLRHPRGAACWADGEASELKITLSTRSFPYLRVPIFLPTPFGIVIRAVPLLRKRHTRALCTQTQDSSHSRRDAPRPHQHL